MQIDRHDVKITRPGNVPFPKNGTTKHDWIDYYRRIGPRIPPCVMP